MLELQLTVLHHWDIGEMRKEAGRVGDGPEAHIGYTKEPELLEEGICKV